MREGLPSSVGEIASQVRRLRNLRARPFAAGAFRRPRLCAAAAGQLGAPLTTVNTSKVSVDVYRVGDRNLISSIARDDFLKPISCDRANEIESQDGAKVWSGAMDIASELNKDVVTDFPLGEAVGKLQPGVYLIAARPWTRARNPPIRARGDL